MKNREVTIYHLIPKLKQTYATLSRFSGYLPSQLPNVLAGIVGVGLGVAGLYVSLWDSNLLSRAFISEQNDSFAIVHTVAGLRNLGNNCFLNVILQALASSSYFLSFLENVIDSNDMKIEDNAENMPLTVALSSLLKELSTVRDEKCVHNPRRVMLALGLYVSSFNLTRQQDAAEAFVHLLSSFEEEILENYVLHDSSLADITASPSKICETKREGQNACDRWKQQFLGPFDGTIGSSLICKICSSMLSMDFEFFRCLDLPPVLHRGVEIMEGSTVMDCFRHFTAVENVDDYRCSRCWHIAALKNLSDKMEKDEAKIEMLRNCVKLDSCDCKSLFRQGELTSTGFSCVTKQLSITHCPRILCINLKRASVNVHGEQIKLQGHISFPLFLDLLPFTQLTMHLGQETLDESLQKCEKRKQNPFVPQLQSNKMQQEMHMIPNIYRIFGENCYLETLSRDKTEISTSNLLGHPFNGTSTGADCGRGIGDENQMVCSDICGTQTSSIDKTGTSYKATSIGGLKSSTSCMYRLSSVVEHYGRPGGGHYAVYRRLGSEIGVGPMQAANQQWVYVSDHEVSVVSEETVLAAEASLLFYDKIEAYPYS